MDFETFARRAEEIIREIPAEFLSGVAGVEAHEGVERHPHLVDIYTLGLCTDDPVARMGDPDDDSSLVHLYHGSFAAIARDDPTFDWEAELRETILHEIRHHIEDRAGLPGLRDEDALFEAHARFGANQPVPHGWYRHGEPMEEDVWAVEDDLFVELRIRPAELDALRGRVTSLTILDEPGEIEIPEDAEDGEVLTYPGEGLETEDGGAGNLHVILRTRG